MTTDDSVHTNEFISRRGFLSYTGKEIVVPAIVAGLVSGISILVSHQLERQHQLSVSVIRSDKAKPPEELPPEVEIFLGYTPTPVPPPSPDDVYTYTIFIRNNGGFPESEVVISVTYISEVNEPLQAQDLEIDASSTLLSRTVAAIEPIELAPSYALTVPQMNPEEWISLKTSWRQEMRIGVEVRSDEIARSTGR